MTATTTRPGRSPADNYHTPYLPGIEAGEIPTVPRSEPAASKSGWWVRTSASQIPDSTGQPGSFRHGLMHGSRLVIPGQGADAARTFKAQAEFLNQRGQTPVWN